MLETLVSMIYNYFNANPCKQCIVKAKCLNTPLFQRPRCDIIVNWSRQKTRAMNIFHLIENTGIIAFLCFIAAMILLTFGLGLWKWYEIGVEFYVKFF